MTMNSGRHVTREDFVSALKEMNTYIDVTVDDLMTLMKKAIKHASLRERESIPLNEVMTPDVITVAPGLALKDAARILIKQKISGLPVVSNNGRLVGIITEADLLRSIGLPAHHPANSLWQTIESMFNSHHGEFMEPAGIVASLMNENVITVKPDATIHEVITVMKKHKIKRVVVCDDLRQVRGIVTRSNLVRVFFDKALTIQSSQHHDGKDAPTSI